MVNRGPYGYRGAGEVPATWQPYGQLRTLLRVLWCRGGSGDLAALWSTADLTGTVVQGRFRRPGSPM
eukprot:512327-Prorocentrum_minimum.AAC.1